MPSQISMRPTTIRLLPAVLLALTTSSSVIGQSYNIATFAGGGLPANTAGTSASLGGSAQAVAVDPRGNLFIAVQNVVLRLDAITGVLTVAAGNGMTGVDGDNGPAARARLSHLTESRQIPPAPSTSRTRSIIASAKSSMA